MDIFIWTKTKQILGRRTYKSNKEKRIEDRRRSQLTLARSGQHPEPENKLILTTSNYISSSPQNNLIAKQNQLARFGNVHRHHCPIPDRHAPSVA